MYIDNINLGTLTKNVPVILLLFICVILIKSCNMYRNDTETIYYSILLIKIGYNITNHWHAHE